MAPQQYKDFGARLGKLHLHLNVPREVDGHPETLVIKANDTSKQVAGEGWHSDVSCNPEPPMGSILCMPEVPANGDDTLFASMYAAYDELSGPMKRTLEGFTAIYNSAKAQAGHGPAINAK